MHHLVGFRKLASSFLFLLILFLVPAKTLLAQDDPCHTRLLPTFVTDKDGNILRGLVSSDFLLQSRGTPVSIVSWNPDGRPHRVVILLDVSGSMRGITGSGFWNSVMWIVQHVASIQSDNAQFALIMFSDQVIETVGFSQGNDAVRHRVAEIFDDPDFAKRQVKNGTAILDALKQGFHQFETPTSADSLLVITDGMDEGSKTKPDEILALLSVPTVRVFSILVVDPFFTRPGHSFDEPSRAPFTDLVQKTGGGVLGPVDLQKAGLTNSPNNAEVRKAMAEQLVQFYRGILQNDLLTIQAPSEITKAEPLRLSLSESAQHRWRHAHVFYPHEVGPCIGGGPPRNTR